MSSDDEWERELELRVGDRTWVITGGLADAAVIGATMFTVGVFLVGLVSIINWVVLGVMAT